MLPNAMTVGVIRVLLLIGSWYVGPGETWLPVHRNTLINNLLVSHAQFTGLPVLHRADHGFHSRLAFWCLM